MKLIITMSSDELAVNPGITAASRARSGDGADSSSRPSSVRPSRRCASMKPGRPPGSLPSSKNARITPAPASSVSWVSKSPAGNHSVLP